jgi:uncharacterized protein (TIGR02678 family)
VNGSLRDAEDREERQQAMRALLARPFVDARDREFALIRRHEPALARTCQELLGYRLELGSTAARATGPPTAAGLRRPLRIRPQSASGRLRPSDEHPVLTDRGVVLLLLTVVALERGGSQTAIAELARETERAGADVDPPQVVDFRERAERVAFADGLDLLCAWGVLEHTAGSRQSYSRRDQAEDEALLTVDRRRLAMLVRDPVQVLEATSVDDLLDESDRHAPTPEGENRARGERLARRLVEDPSLIASDLEEADRAYFLGQRARLEGGVAMATGLAVERRAEGTALIVDDRALTDVPFPTKATVKQLALLLCDMLAAAPTDRPLSPEHVRAAVRDLLEAHREHWQRNPDDPEDVRAVAAAATRVLVELDLARSTPGGGLLPRPPVARFRAPQIRRPGGESG